MKKKRKSNIEDLENWYKPGHVRFAILADLRVLDTDDETFRAIRYIEDGMRAIRKNLARAHGIKSEVKRGRDGKYT